MPFWVKKLVRFAQWFKENIKDVSVLCRAGRTTRQLQQRGGEVVITRQNASQFTELVADARRNTVFLVAEDVRLPSVIEVDTPRLTFRGDPNARPSLTCADDAEGFSIQCVRSCLLFRLRDVTSGDAVRMESRWRI